MVPERSAPTGRQLRTPTVNVANVERWASALGGAALTAYGIKQLKERSVAGAMITAAGTTLMYRGATGHCPVYAATGIDTANGETDTREVLSTVIERCRGEVHATSNATDAFDEVMTWQFSRR